MWNRLPGRFFSSLSIFNYHSVPHASKKQSLWGTEISSKSTTFCATRGCSVRPHLCYSRGVTSKGLRYHEYFPIQRPKQRSRVVHRWLRFLHKRHRYMTKTTETAQGCLASLDRHSRLDQHVFAYAASLVTCQPQ